MSAETTDRDYWLSVGWSACSPAAKARASRDLDVCALCGATQGMCELSCESNETPEPRRCAACLRLTDVTERCEHCGAHNDD